ncbi:MAG: ABC transporter substrate-binding protein [Cyanobacteria bacterium P01_F01_bin.86]
MQRRRLFKQLALGTAGATFFSACSNSNQVFTPSDDEAAGGNGPLIEWRMATSWPEDLDIVFGTAQEMCLRVGELTNGRFKITAFPAGGIAPPFEILDTVQNGSTECGHTAAYHYIAKNRALAFATSVPFGFNPQQHQAWLYGAGGMELLRKLYANFNIVNFPAGSTGNQMGGWFREKINSVSDLQGLKMRIPGIGGEVLKRIGVEVQNMRPSELLLALERNTIDAAEWVGPYEDEKLGLNQYARYYYYPGWHEPGTTYDLIINRDAYEALPESYRKALEVVAFEAQVRMLSKYNAANREALQRLISEGTELTAYSAEILQATRQAADELYAEYSSQDAAFKEIYNDWNAFREGIYRWNNINEGSYADLIASS